jgi:hypothetical protein
MIWLLFLSIALVPLFLVSYLAVRSLKIVRKYIVRRLEALEEVELFAESDRDEVLSREG